MLGVVVSNKDNWVVFLIHEILQGYFNVENQYVCDNLIRKNEHKKSDGYKIRKGRKSTKVVYDLLKK